MPVKNSFSPISLSHKVSGLTKVCFVSSCDYCKLPHFVDTWSPVVTLKVSFYVCQHKESDVIAFYIFELSKLCDLLN